MRLRVVWQAAVLGVLTGWARGRMRVLERGGVLRRRGGLLLMVLLMDDAGGSRLLEMVCWWWTLLCVVGVMLPQLVSGNPYLKR